MTITVILSDASIDVADDGKLGKRVFLRVHPGSKLEPLNESDVFRKHVERCARLTDAELIAELHTISRMWRTDSPPQWSLWLLTFIATPGFLARLQLRSGEMRSRDPHGAAIGRALRKASTAVGWGNRGRGRTPKKKAA